MRLDHRLDARAADSYVERMSARNQSKARREPCLGCRDGRFQRPLARRLTSNDRRAWPTCDQGPSHDFTFNDEEIVAIAGDWESNLEAVAAILSTLQQHRPGLRTILQLGDLRFDPPFVTNGRTRRRTFIRDLDALLAHHGVDRLLVTPGNHDWWDQLHAEFLRHPRRLYRIATRIWIMPRGFRFRIGNTDFMSFGGAASLHHGPGDRGWSEHEAPTVFDVAKAAIRGATDVLLTHETPQVSSDAVNAITHREAGWAADRLAASRQSRMLITELVALTQPRMVFHGHMHVAGEVHEPGCRSVYSLGVAGKFGNAGFLNILNQEFDWLANQR